jgi:hypothetical protein
MTHQLALNYQPPADAMSSRYDAAPPPRDWDRDARAFFEAHPEVMRYFETVALGELEDAREDKRRNYLSAKWVWEECRLHFGPRGVSLNNNYTKAAAELFRCRHPRHASKLRTRGK